MNKEASLLTMSTNNNFQQTQFSEVSERREKVDFCLTNYVKSQEMENLQRKVRHVSDFETEFNLRKSLAWDNAFFTSPGVLDPEELLETLNFRVEDDGSNVTEHKESNPIHSHLTEPANTSSTRESSLRKSLAWDSAFFTSSGVLDAEELSIVNKGFKRSDMHLLLPGIKEEIVKSVESNSTADSHDYSLANLEIDLFNNLRASMETPENARDKQATASSKLKRSRIGIGHSSKSSKVPLQVKKHPALSRESPLSSDKVLKMSGDVNVLRAAQNRWTTMKHKAAKSMSRYGCASDSVSKSMDIRRIVDSRWCLESSLSLSRYSTPPGSSLVVAPRRGIPVTGDATRALECNNSGHYLSSKLTDHRKNVLESPTCSATAKSLRNSKPSRLRIPTPKNGYFDEANCRGLPQDGQGKLSKSDPEVVNGAANRRYSKRPTKISKQPGNELGATNDGHTNFEQNNFSEDKENITTSGKQVCELSITMKTFNI